MTERILYGIKSTEMNYVISINDKYKEIGGFSTSSRRSYDEMGIV